MREIKFRAYNPETKEMLLSDEMPTIGMFFTAMELCPTGDLMQFTGLKDKNGVDVYEGDVVEHEIYNHSAPNSKRKQVVYFNQGCFCIKDVNHEKEDELGDFHTDLPLYYSKAPNKITVLGSIHQNPELL